MAPYPIGPNVCLFRDRVCPLIVHVLYYVPQGARAWRFEGGDFVLDQRVAPPRRFFRFFQKGTTGRVFCWGYMVGLRFRLIVLNGAADGRGLLDWGSFFIRLGLSDMYTVQGGGNAGRVVVVSKRVSLWGPRHRVRVALRHALQRLNLLHGFFDHRPFCVDGSRGFAALH